MLVQVLWTRITNQHTHGAARLIRVQQGEGLVGSCAADKQQLAMRFTVRTAQHRGSCSQQKTYPCSPCSPAHVIFWRKVQGLWLSMVNTTSAACWPACCQRLELCWLMHGLCLLMNAFVSLSFGACSLTRHLMGHSYSCTRSWQGEAGEAWAST